MNLTPEQQELKRVAQEADAAPDAWPFYRNALAKHATPAAILALLAQLEAQAAPERSPFVLGVKPSDWDAQMKTASGAQAFLESMKPRANKVEMGTRFWTGWALVEAYKAGAAQPVQATPDALADWQFVPKMPTPEMIRAGQKSKGRSTLRHMENQLLIYHDMLAAAPRPPEPLQ